MSRSRNSVNSESVISVGTPFIARLLVCTLFVWKALGRLTLTLLARAAFILLSLCSIMTSCTESPITTKSRFGSFLTCEILRLGWNCVNSPINFLQFLNFSSTALGITGIVSSRLGLGRTGVPRGDLEEHGLSWLGSMGELLALRS